MSMHNTAARRQRGRPRRRLAALAWGAVLLLMAALLAGGAQAMGAAQRPAAHPVLDAFFITHGYGVGGGGSAVEMWADATLARVRLRLLPGRESLYYLRDSGVWYVVGRAGPGAPWRRTRLTAAQEPSLLTEDGVRRLFAALRGRATGQVTPTALHNHMAVAFTSAAVSWPYRYAGRTTVWLDAATGLPLQFRNVMEGDKGPLTVLTAVNRVRMVSSSALPADFFTPPDQPPTLWDTLLHRIVG